MTQEREEQLREQEIACLKKIGHELEEGFNDLIDILMEIRETLDDLPLDNIANAVDDLRGDI